MLEQCSPPAAAPATPICWRCRRTFGRRSAEHGVAHYWIIDPEARTLEALTLLGGKWVDAGSFDETATARVAPFEAVEIPVGRLSLPRRREAEPG